VDLEAVKGDIERVIVTEEQLQARIKELAAYAARARCIA
jgi:cell division septum initiation protein DivIVA